MNGLRPSGWAREHLSFSHFTYTVDTHLFRAKLAGLSNVCDCICSCLPSVLSLSFETKTLTGKQANICVTIDGGCLNNLGVLSEGPPQHIFSFVLLTFARVTSRQSVQHKSSEK